MAVTAQTGHGLRPDGAVSRQELSPTATESVISTENLLGTRRF